MNKRAIFWWIRGPGSVVLIIFAIFAVCYYVSKHRQEKEAREKANQPQREIGRVVEQGDNPTSAPKEQVLLDQRLTPVNHAPEEPVSLTSPTPAAAQLLPLAASYEELPAPTATPEPTPRPIETWLPPAELIPCALVNTIESSHLNTPVLAVVTRNIWQIGHLIIPWGTHVSCFASNTAVRDRIEVAGLWLFTFGDGRQLKVPGIALDRQASPANNQFGIEDGTAGLRGDVIETDQYGFLKGLLGVITSAGLTTGTAIATSALQAQHTTGVTALPDITPVFATYLNQMLNGTGGDSRFVRVPSSTEFYLFPTDTILPGHRQIVTTSQMTQAAPESVPNNPLQGIRLQPNQNENQTPYFRY
ncbi:MAG: hypothetical protein JO232_24210 [Verrucomicrobia bacterium]|nr:hypothetical protein [Verrucomicrobiota bacterium]